MRQETAKVIVQEQRMAAELNQLNNEADVLKKVRCHNEADILKNVRFINEADILKYVRFINEADVLKM